MFLILLGFLFSPLKFHLEQRPNKPRNVPVIGLFAKDIGVIEAGYLGPKPHPRKCFKVGVSTNL